MLMDFEADIDETRHDHYSGPLRKMPNRSDLSLVFRIGFCNVSPEHFFCEITIYTIAMKNGAFIDSLPTKKG